MTSGTFQKHSMVCAAIEAVKSAKYPPAILPEPAMPI
jgi:hypothetical protein